MTRYFDKEDLSEEQRAKAEQKRADYETIKKLITPLLDRIDKYVKGAKKGRGSKKERNSLLTKINQAEMACNRLGQRYYEFDPENKKIGVLGAYRLVQMKKRREY